MCLSCRNNKNPQTVKLSIPSSVTPSHDKEPKDPICKHPIVENDQTAHISLQIFNFQRAQTQNNHHASISSVTLALHPEEFQTFAFAPGPYLRKLACFGEAVFRQGCKKPQEEKVIKLTLFSNPRIIHNILGLTAGKTLFCHLPLRHLGACPVPTAPYPGGQQQHDR
jgi:hypothetical protein